MRRACWRLRPGSRSSSVHVQKSPPLCPARAHSNRPRRPVLFSPCVRGPFQKRRGNRRENYGGARSGVQARVPRRQKTEDRRTATVRQDRRSTPLNPPLLRGEIRRRNFSVIPNRGSIGLPTSNESRTRDPP